MIHCQYTFSESLDNIITLINDGTENPSLQKDEKWQESMESAFSPIKEGWQLLERIDKEGKVPSKMEPIHELAVEAFQLMSKAGDKIVFL